MIKNYLLDSNIVIYLFNRDIKYVRFFEKLEGEYSISVITYIEMLMGEIGSDVFQTLDRFSLLPIDKSVSNKSIPFLYKRKNNKGFRATNIADYLIGATAVLHNLPLITNNPKDFKIFDNLEIITP